MDDLRFDEWVRGRFGAVRSRRGLLAAAAGGAAALLGGGPLTETADAKKKKNKKRCARANQACKNRKGCCSGQCCRQRGWPGARQKRCAPNNGKCCPPHAGGGWCRKAESCCAPYSLHPTGSCCPGAFPNCCGETAPGKCCAKRYPNCCPTGCCPAGYPNCCPPAPGTPWDPDGIGYCCAPGYQCCAEGCCWVGGDPAAERVGDQPVAMPMAPAQKAAARDA